jgi:4-amino-4-deoxy-L-arabinose transferase-like glycosyltransferase
MNLRMGISAAALTTFVFLAAQVIAALFSISSGHLQFGADAADYWEPARGLIELGRYVDLRVPGEPATYRTPGYPLFIAALTLPTGGDLWLLISIQVLLLLLTGFLGRSMLADIVPRYANLGFALVIFNPNAFITAQLVQTDTLGTFFFVLTLWALWRYRRNPSVLLGILIGGALSLASLVRPTTQHLVLLLPIGLPLLAGIAGDWRAWPRHAAVGVLSAAVAIVIATPWLVHMNDAGQGYSFSSARVKWVFALDNVLLLEQENSGVSGESASKVVKERQRRYIESLNMGWQVPETPEQYDVARHWMVAQLASYPLSTMAKAAVKGVGNLFVGGGATNYHRLFGLRHVSSWDVRVAESRGFVGSLAASVSSSSPLALVITAFAVFFAVVLRIVGLVGLYVMIRRRLWSELFIVTGAVGFFATVHIFNSAARYRIPVEPLLIMLALIGIAWLLEQLEGERSS